MAEGVGVAQLELETGTVLLPVDDDNVDDRIADAEELLEVLKAEELKIEELKAEVLKTDELETEELRTDELEAEELEAVELETAAT